MHQADWLASLLHGDRSAKHIRLNGLGARDAYTQSICLFLNIFSTSFYYRSVSDWNNALKLGFDPALERFPDWLMNQVIYPVAPDPSPPPMKYE